MLVPFRLVLSVGAAASVVGMAGETGMFKSFMSLALWKPLGMLTSHGSLRDCGCSRLGAMKEEGRLSASTEVKRIVRTHLVTEPSNHIHYYIGTEMLNKMWFIIIPM